MKKITVLLAIVLLLGVFQPYGVYAAQNGSETVADGYIVQLKQPDNGVRLMNNIELEEICGERGVYKVKDLTAIELLGDAVEYYEPEQKVTLFALPNDPYANKQWALNSLGMEYAWNRGYEGAGVRVAIIDSGVNSLHEDFEGAVFDKGKNMIDGSYDVKDETGHGTFVCGVIAAARDNGIGIAGLCGGVTIVPLKCFGNRMETSSSYIISAIYEAVDVLDCDVINLSLGMESDMSAMRQAVEYATAKGVIVLSAVGNTGTDVLNYPAAYDNVIGVGSVDENNKVTSFSQKNSSVFVVAPGSGVVSTGYKTHSDYVIGGGTSYSTPHVAVAAAILKQCEPTATPSDFAELLKLSSKDLGQPGYDTSYGYGSLDIAAFVSALESYGFADINDIFSDVQDHWAKEAIEFCVTKKYFNGVSANKFAPELAMNRAMFVAVLSRMSGESITGFKNAFSDVPDDAWYAQSAAWGSATKIVSGVADGVFDPEGLVTREQMAALLYRFATVYELTDGSADSASLSAFKDSAEVSSWAVQAMSWAVGNGLITGRDGARLCPSAGAKRSEVAAIISRFSNAFFT